MGRLDRKTTGPLSAVQVGIISGLHGGERQLEIAKRMGCTEQYVAKEMYVARAKLGVNTTPQAIARYSEALTYLRAADLLEKIKITKPVDGTQEHVNHVLDGIAAQYRLLAAKILPPE